MYTDFYGLSSKPFDLTPDPEFLYLSQNHKEALAHLTYGVDSKSGFVMITGEVGAGKTTLLRTLVQSLGDSALLSQVTNTRVSYKELLGLILDDFGIDPRGLDKVSLLATLNDFLIEKYHDGKNCVLIVDETQNLDVRTLEGLRLLSNLETEKSKLLQIILAGQPGLRELIDSRELEQLRQRITVRYHLGPLSPEEVREYIHHRLGKVITDPHLAPEMPDEIIPRIHAATGGIPRLINVLCDAALLLGFVEEKRRIDGAVIDEVARQITRDQGGGELTESGLDPVTDPDIDRRIAQIESRLEAVMGSGDRRALEFAEMAGRPGPDAQDFTAREEAIAQRLAAVERSEAEFNQRLTRVKAEWKRRMGQLEEARKKISGGKIETRSAKVYLFDRDPRIQHALREWLAGAGIPAEIYGDIQGFAGALGQSSDSGFFAVAFVGSDGDGPRS